MVRTGREYIANPESFTEEEKEELRNHCHWFLERLEEHKQWNKVMALELANLYLNVLKKMGDY